MNTVNDGLSTALEAVQARIESGIAEAELELAEARARVRELKRSLADAGAIRTADPDVAPAPARTALPPVVSADRRAMLPSLPPRWLLALGAIRRLDLERLPRVFARNIILRWEGDNPIAGTHLGHKQALTFVRQLQPFLDPASVVVEDLHVADANVEILASTTLRIRTPVDVTMEARITIVARFDDAGMITLLFATPEDPKSIDGFLRAATMSDAHS
jgi:hypothetical protein